MTNLLLRDLIICNLGTGLLSAVFYMAGWSLINAVSISCLVIFAVLLIWGGALGFFLSSASFDLLSRFLRIGRKREEDQETAVDRKKGTTKDGERKELVDAGKRMIILSFIILGESLVITLAYLIA